MKSKLTAICCLLTCICLPVLAQGTAFTYQGRLNDGVSPANGSYDLRFAVYDAAGAGTPQGNLLTNTATGVTNGLFTVTLDFGAGPFSNGAPRWLDIAARTNNAGPFTQMNPRQPLTATPYAIYAGGAATVAANSVGNSQLASGAVTSDKLADGSITALDVDSVSFSNTFWKVDGNAGTPFSTSFLGTTDFRPLDFRVNNLRALHLDANDSTSPNVIGGHANNISTAFGAFIGGGGNASAPQRIEGAYSAIVSGWGNTNAGLSGSIGGGVRNLIDSPASSAFIAAGLDNHIGAANYTAIGGGQLNRIQTGASWSLIGGGVLNLIQSNATAAVIAGGDSNTNAGNWAVVAGGRANTASADYAFAAGRRAQASHPGAFVWADSQNADFGSSGANQFLIRAAGGVGINTTQPVSALQVSGTVTADNFSGAYSGDGGGLVNVNAAALGGLAVSNLWQLGGNAGTTPGSQFLGTSDAQALELKVNGRRALRLEPTLVNSTHSNIVNVVGGSAVNVAANGVYGATVSGGGAENYLGVAYTNSVSANFGTVAGGLGNLSAGLHSAVGGGFGNTAAGFAATAPGGSHNQARGDFSFAAGNNALATNSGAYVWADSQVAPFGSTAGDQTCALRSQGGVQLNTDTSLFFGSQVRQMINL